MKTKKIEGLWAHVHGLGVLAALGSYTAAAGRLGLSKAAMSHRVAELEQAAGVPLVRRTTRSVRLTPAGQQLVDATRGAYDDIERSFAQLRDLADAPSGLVRLTAPVALGRQQVVPRLPTFLQQNPAVRIELDLSDRLSLLAQEGFDLAVRHVETVPDTHVAWPLCATHALLVASPDYLARRGTPWSPQELEGHDCLHYLRGGRSPTWSFERTGRGKGSPQRTSVAIRGSFAANNSETLREMALAGCGIALVPDFSIAGEIDAGRLVEVLPRWRSVGAFGERVYAMRPYSAQVPRAVQALVAFLRDSLKGGFARRHGEASSPR